MDLREPLYCDTSALVKLIIKEAESVALLKFLCKSDLQLTSSEICEVELTRTIKKIEPELQRDAESLLQDMVLLPLTPAIRSRAGNLRPMHLKSLDAVHLATAIEIQASSNSFLSYDKALNMAARGAGLEPVSPA